MEGMKEKQTKRVIRGKSEKKDLEKSFLRGVNKVGLYGTTCYIRVLERNREKK